MLELSEPMSLHNESYVAPMQAWFLPRRELGVAVTVTMAVWTTGWCYCASGAILFAFVLHRRFLRAEIEASAGFSSTLRYELDGYRIAPDRGKRLDGRINPGLEPEVECERFLLKVLRGKQHMDG